MTRILDSATAKALDIAESVRTLASDPGRKNENSQSTDLLRNEIELLRLSQKKAVRIELSVLRGQLEESRRDFVPGAYKSTDDLLAEWPTNEGSHAPAT